MRSAPQTRWTRDSIKLLTVLFGLVVSNPSLAQVNAVGYFDASFVAGSNLIANPFSSTNNSIANLLRGVPAGSVFLPWYSGSDYFGPSNRYDQATGWTDGGMQLIFPAGGFLVLPSATQISFVGEVWPDKCIHFQKAYTLCSIMPRTSLGCVFCFADSCPNFPDGMSFHRWNRATQRYEGWCQFDASQNGWYDFDYNRVEPKIAPDEAALFFTTSDWSARFGGENYELAGISQPCEDVELTLVNPSYSGNTFSFQFWASRPLNYSVWRSYYSFDSGWVRILQSTVTNARWVTITDYPFTRAIYYRVKSYGTPLQDPSRIGTTFSFRFCAQAGAAYTIQRKLTLDASVWETLMTTNGVGSLTVVDNNATNRSGYYRLLY